MTRPHRFVVVSLLAGCVAASTNTHDRSFPWANPGYFATDNSPGGTTTVPDRSVTALGRAVRNLEPHRWPQMLAGKRVFVREWSAGLGPLYNASSCAGCHFKDGRGGPPWEHTPDVRLLVKLAADPLYGGQLSEHASPEVRAEGRLDVQYQHVGGVLDDGARFELRRPSYALRDLASGPIGVVMSARMPGSLAGMGLLEAIPAANIMAAADPTDGDGDGISGRVNWVPETGQVRPALGRFGWKAGQPSIVQQIATAFREDMGLTSWLRPHSGCTSNQPDCATHDAVNEVSARMLDDVTHYVQLLAVPARRPAADDARGRQLFLATGCAACHTPRQVTAPSATFPELTNQTIYPYTDLLLHDMGPALADALEEHGAKGTEWRTPPLWGLGLLSTIHGRLRLLHDGRARSVEEAILWHAGEGSEARRAYRSLGAADRASLVRFIESL